MGNLWIKHNVLRLWMNEVVSTINQLDNNNNDKNVGTSGERVWHTLNISFSTSPLLLLPFFCDLDLCLSFCSVNKTQMGIWMKRWPNEWSDVGIWIGKKCQKKGWLVIMKLRGCCYSLVIFFMFLWLFVVCKWWVYFGILHGLNNVWHWLIWCFVLFLDVVCYKGGHCHIRRNFWCWEAKFLG
jgi:hypothetical protein